MNNDKSLRSKQYKCNDQMRLTKLLMTIFVQIKHIFMNDRVTNEQVFSLCVHHFFECFCLLKIRFALAGAEFTKQEVRENLVMWHG
jgi:hypothetical protein